MIRTILIVLMFSLLLPFHACTKDTGTESASETTTKSASETPPASASDTATESVGDTALTSALSAGPPAISSDATVMDWDNNVLREGTNGWTCLPDIPGTPGTDPWCVNEPWLNLLDALKNKKDPTYTEIGIAFMLQRDTPVSNTDPSATEPTSPEDWVDGLGPHLMLLLPNQTGLETFPVEWRAWRPWVMWKDTPYAHLMIPIGQ